SPCSTHPALSYSSQLSLHDALPICSAPVAGHLRRIPFKAGAEVEAGKTVLAVIDPVSPAMLDARNRALAEARRDTAAKRDQSRRSEEHTSELQSPDHVVCRLLLENK